MIPDRVLDAVLPSPRTSDPSHECRIEFGTRTGTTGEIKECRHDERGAFAATVGLGKM